MPWQEVSIMQLRREFLRLVEQGGEVRPLCRRFGISPSTAYKWLARYRAGADLADQSRRPHQSPTRTQAPVEAQVLALRAKHPVWGARKLRRRLLDQGHVMPATSTVHAILQRHGCISAAASEATKPFRRFVHAAPNDLWQMDFKGHVAMRERRCHPLTVLDDHSRFSLCLAACGDEMLETVRGHLIATFRRYGLPQRMTMDNGSPWGDTNHGGFTALEVWLMKQRIQVSHSRPYHPQTQGKDERFHRTLDVELLQGVVHQDLAHAQRDFDVWRDIYNQERPHEALDLAVPASRYGASTREYRDNPPPPEYANPQCVRRIAKGGLLSWRGRTYRVGKAFIGEPVEVRPTPDERLADVYWSTTRIAQLDVIDHTSISGRRLP